MVETESQAAFARRHGVARKTVTAWKQGGLVRMFSPKLVDVEKSNEILAARSRTTRRGIVRRDRERAIAAAKRDGVELATLKSFEEGSVQTLSLFVSKLGPVIAGCMVEAGIPPIKACLASEIIAWEVESLASDVLEIDLAIPAISSGDCPFPLHAYAPIPWTGLAAHGGAPIDWTAVAAQRASLQFWGRKESLPLWRRLQKVSK